jgi:hypothetical protein
MNWKACCGGRVTCREKSCGTSRSYRNYDFQGLERNARSARHKVNEAGDLKFLLVEIWPQLPKIILEVKFTDGIEIARRDAQAAAERLEARLRGWNMPTE